VRVVQWHLCSLVLVACGCSQDDDGSNDTSGSEVEVVEHGAQVCADTDRSIAPFDRRTSSTPAMSDWWIWGGGITAADLDGDGVHELLVALEQGLELYVYNAAEDVYDPIGQGLFQALGLTYGSGTTVADYDGDGDLDVYVMRVLPGTTGNPDPPDTTGLGDNHLLRNDGNLTFTDVTTEAGVSGCDGPAACYRTMTSSWGDYDLDGDLDLYVGNYGYVDETPGTTSGDMTGGEPDFLYRNNGDGTFTDISDVIPPEVDIGYTYTGGFYDLDADNDLDLYVINDFGTETRTNSVMWNDPPGTLTWNAGDTSGLQIRMTGMGLGIGDLNGDKKLDLAIPEWKKNKLLMSYGDLWIDEADADGFTLDFGRDQQVGWGTELGDMDNDGDQDIVSQYGFVANDNEEQWANALSQPDALYTATPDGSGGYTFVDDGVDWGVNDPFMNRGVVLADLDRDGWLDVGKRDLEGENVLYISECGQEGWLTIHLRQPGTMNLFAIGAKVEVEVAGELMLRHLFAGGTGYASQPPPELHFGLGMHDAVDVIRVIWPDGRQDEVTGIAARQQVTITRPAL